MTLEEIQILISERHKNVAGLILIIGSTTAMQLLFALFHNINYEYRNQFYITGPSWPWSYTRWI